MWATLQLRVSFCGIWVRNAGNTDDSHALLLVGQPELTASVPSAVAACTRRRGHLFLVLGVSDQHFGCQHQ
jgi:hypothetical protein